MGKAQPLSPSIGFQFIIIYKASGMPKVGNKKKVKPTVMCDENQMITRKNSKENLRRKYRRTHCVHKYYCVRRQHCGGQQLRSQHTLKAIKMWFTMKVTASRINWHLGSKSPAPIKRNLILEPDSWMALSVLCKCKPEKRKQQKCH